VARQRLALHLSAADVPRAEALLELAGAETVSIADAGDDPVLEPAPDTTPLWPNVIVRALFPAAADLTHLIAALEQAFPAGAAVVEQLDDADWQAALRQVFAARPFGRRIWLTPSDDAHAPPPGRVKVRLHMGLAFGTGEHPTTALCLDWLDARANDGETILDYGCGSGVLAIAALALGARAAYAVDNDPQAVDATRANLALNSLSDRAFVGLPEELAPVVVDVLAANILAGPLVELAPRFATHVRAGGAIVLSGVLERQAERVQQAFAPFFAGFDQAAHDGWVRIAATRRA
jgi:ribosomal protein L11 methyltransferase